MNDIIWPNFAPKAGDSWPKAVVDGGTDLGGGGFNTGACANGAHPNMGQRFSWVEDPLGSGMVVARIEVREGDVAEPFGGCRGEMWQYPRLLAPGITKWNAWSVALTDDFGPAPSGWGMTIGQIHPGDGASPVHGFYLTPRGMEYQVRSVEDWVWQQTIAKWKRIFLLTRTFYTSEWQADTVMLWASIGFPPDPSKPALRKWGAPTIYPEATPPYNPNSWPKVGEYRDQNSKGTNVVYLYGYGQADTAAQAMVSARFGAQPSADSLPVTHTVSPDGLVLTLAWTPVAGAGYELWIDSVRHKSFSRDATKRTWKMDKLPGKHKYEVRALAYGVSGSVIV